jgi:hypothetical protein
MSAAVTDVARRPVPRLAVLWDERVVSTLGDHQYLITVPFIGGPVPDGIHPQLTAELRDRWAVRGNLPWKIVSVVAAFKAGSSYGGRLTLALTAIAAGSSSPRLDSPRVARDLGDAVQQIYARHESAAPETVRRDQSTSFNHRSGLQLVD